MIEIQLRREILDRLTRDLEEKAARIVSESAAAIEGGAKQRAPVDTGALRNSIQAVPTGKLSAEVRVGQSYSHFVEFGTSKAPAQPYLTPAAEEERPKFLEALEDLFR